MNDPIHPTSDYNQAPVSEREWIEHSKRARVVAVKLFLRFGTGDSEVAQMLGLAPSPEPKARPKKASGWHKAVTS